METGKLDRRLSGVDATMVVISDMIGSGIFFTTGFVALNIPDGEWILVAWLFGGLLALLGAISYAEMAAMLPEAGGEYVYLRKALGPLAGFLSGWASLFIGFSAPIAIGGLGFSTYMEAFLPGFASTKLLEVQGFSLLSGNAIAALVIVVLALIHLAGRSTDKRVQLVLTLVKLLAFGGFIVAGFAALKSPGLLTESVPASALTLTGFFAGVVPITFSYSGWNASSYLAGEIKNPGKNLPFSLIAGTIIVTIIYLLMNTIYVQALPIEKLRGLGPVATEAVKVLWGDAGSQWISGVIAVSILGALFSLLFIGPRVIYAMARHSLLPALAGRVRREVPAGAIVFLAVIAIVLVLAGNLRDLLQFAGFILVLFSFLAVLSVIILRFRFPDLERPYRVWLYPLPPVLFCAFSIYLMYASFIFKPNATLAGLFLVALGIPYYFWKSRREAAKGNPS